MHLAKLMLIRTWLSGDMVSLDEIVSNRATNKIKIAYVELGEMRGSNENCNSSAGRRCTFILEHVVPLSAGKVAAAHGYR